MTILDPIVSDFLGIPYPDEECDPHYDQFKAMVLKMEEIMLFNKVAGSMVVGGGGARVWTVLASTLTWTANFELIVPYWGFKIIVPYGPDAIARQATLQDGQFLYVDIPMSMPANVTQNFQIGSKLNPTEHNHFIVAARIGGRLYVRSIGEMV